jgi:PAS domain S-box-containing protein
MTLRDRLATFIKPPYQLKTLLLLTLSVLAVLMIGLNGLISYQRIQRETLTTARKQSASIADLVAKENLEALVVNDIGSIESSLQQVSQLPDVDNIAVARFDGRILATAQNGNARIFGFGWKVQPPSSADATQTADQTREEQLTAWSPIGVAGRPPLGWVKLEYSLAQRRLEVQRLWHNSLDALMLTLLLILVILPFLLEAVLKPIRRLSVIAGKLSSNIGRQIHIDTQILEAKLVADALNAASVDLALQAARTQIIVNTAAVAIIGLDDQAHVVSANPATTSLFGQEESELIGREVSTCIPGLTEDELRSMFGPGDDRQDKHVYRIVRQDFRGTRRDGTLFPIEIAFGHVAHSKSLRYACIVRDVTDERAAQESSELYERALASSHNGVFLTQAFNDTHPIIFVNEAFQRITGLAASDVLGRDVESLARGRDNALWTSEFRQAVQEKRGAKITIHDEPVGNRQLTAEVSLSPVHSVDGKLTNFIGIVSDITDRVRAEEANTKRSAQLNAIFSLSPDGFVLLDTQGELAFANPAFERMTGRSWRSTDCRMSFATFRSQFSDLCLDDRGLPELELNSDDEMQWQARIVLARPQHRVLQATARRNLAGRSETIMYFRDVTHEDEVDRMKSEFLASAAHELRTPMVSILGFTELLIKREFSPERRLDMLQTIHRQSGLLVKMINELLDLARIESRRGLDMKIGEHPLGELVDDSIRGLMRADNERQVLRGPIPQATVMVDPEKMQLALNNLLSNAFKYSPDGGDVILRAGIDDLNGRSYVVLEVEDHGMGMKPEQLERAFERFYRADTTGNIPGTGLGLSLVKEIAELHGGYIEMESQYGQGTTAKLWIPRSTAVSPSKPSSPDGAETHGRVAALTQG